MKIVTIHGRESQKVITLPKQVCEDLKLEKGETLILKVVNGEIIIKKVVE